MGSCASNPFALPMILDKYFVLPEGTIYNTNTLTEVKHSYVTSRSGRRYSKVRLFKNSKCHNYLVHRLVAYFYCNNGQFHLECKNEVNHIDCNTKNNSFENLEILTHSDNAGHWRKLKRERMAS